MSDFKTWFDKEYPLPEGYERGPMGRDLMDGCEKAYEAGRAELRLKLAELEEWLNNEASVCPEDVGFVEYIKAKDKRIARLGKALGKIVETLESNKNYFEHHPCWYIHKIAKQALEEPK